VERKSKKTNAERERKESGLKAKRFKSKLEEVVVKA